MRAQKVLGAISSRHHPLANRRGRRFPFARAANTSSCCASEQMRSRIECMAASCAATWRRQRFAESVHQRSYIKVSRAALRSGPFAMETLALVLTTGPPPSGTTMRGRTCALPYRHFINLEGVYVKQHAEDEGCRPGRDGQRRRMPRMMPRTRLRMPLTTPRTRSRMLLTTPRTRPRTLLTTPRTPSKMPLMTPRTMPRMLPNKQHGNSSRRPTRWQCPALPPRRPGIRQQMQLINHTEERGSL